LGQEENLMRERKHKFFGSNSPAETFPAEDLNARIASALRYMATKVTSRVDEANEMVAKDTSRELSRKIASRTLDYLSTEGIDIRQARMMDLGAGLGMLPVIDIHPAFQAQNDPLALFPLRIGLGHYHEAGNRLVAQEILHFISLATDSVRPAYAITHDNEGHTEPPTTKAGLSNSSGVVR
jgi:hypothetical protein